MSKKKPEPPLDWLRQSVWAGEELPEELELLEEIEPERPTPQRKPAAKSNPKSARKARWR